MTAADWGPVPRLLAEFAARGYDDRPHMIGAVDQKRAALRDWLDARGLPVTDPETLRAVLAGAEMLVQDVALGVKRGVLPAEACGLVGPVFAGLVVTLGDYVPDEVRRG